MVPGGLKKTQEQKSKIYLTRGEYSLVNMAGEPQRVVELFPTGKSQEPRVTLLQVVTTAKSDIAANNMYDWNVKSVHVFQTDRMQDLHWTKMNKQPSSTVRAN